MTNTELAEFDQIHPAMLRLREQIHRLVIGQDEAVEHLTAAMEGLPTPSCEHVRRIAPAVLGHRIVTNYTAAGEGVNAGDVVRELLEKVGE